MALKRIQPGSKAESHVPAFKGSRARALEEEQAELGGWRTCQAPDAAGMSA